MVAMVAKFPLFVVSRYARQHASLYMDTAVPRAGIEIEDIEVRVSELERAAEAAARRS